LLLQKENLFPFPDLSCLIIDAFGECFSSPLAGFDIPDAGRNGYHCY
jgi:hypothetical protein